MHACHFCGTDIGWDAPSGVCSSDCLRAAQGFPPVDGPVHVRELRHTSAGNVYRLERIEGEWRYVKRVRTRHGNSPSREWDADVTYRWHSSQWEEGIPLLNGPTAEYPHFGVSSPR